MAQSVTVEFGCLEDALRHCDFQLGRGGCCFRAGRMLLEEKTVDLTVHFLREGFTLKTQGMVRWTMEKTLQAGITFDYLDPECRDWVIGAMHGRLSRSFIPPCDWSLCEPLSVTGTIESPDTGKLSTQP
jgi:hypothetical protein